MKFYCNDCKHEFETDKPIKKEYKDYILGTCWKNVSSCPICGQESNEKITPKPQKLSVSLPQYSCNRGCGCCG